MRLLKKVGRLAVGATLLTSLFATSAGTVAAVDPTAVGTVFPYTVTLTPSKPADGTSYYSLRFSSSLLTSVGATVMNITATGGTFLTGTGTFDGPTLSVTYPRSQIIITNPAQVVVADNSQLWLVASSAGTATVTVMVVKAGTTSTDSAQTYAFTSPTSTVVSTTTSATKIADNAGTEFTTIPGDAGGVGLRAWTAVKDSSGNNIESGAVVTWTISGPATFGAPDDGKATTTSSTFDTGFYKSAEIKSTGVGGTATITTSIAYLGKTYTLPNKTLAFAGAVDSVKLKSNVASIPSDDSNNSDLGAYGNTEGKELIVQVNDAGGLPVSTGVSFAISAYGTANIITVNPGASPRMDYNSTIKGYYLDVDCNNNVGTSTVTITASKGTVTKTSTVATFTCAAPLTEAAPGTFTVTSASKSVAPGKNLNILVTVKNKAGLNAPDGTWVTAATNIGAVTSATGGNSAKTVNGVATFIFLAPPSAGTATVTGFVENADGPHSITITVSGTPTTDEGPVKLTAGAKTLVFGAKATLDVAFSDVTTAQTFDMETSINGTTWTKMTDGTGLKTEDDGTYSMTFTPKRTAWYRVSYTGADSKTLTSPKVQIAVRSSVTMTPRSAAAISIKRGKAVTFVATVKPINTSGGKVRFSVFRQVDGDWVPFARKDMAYSTSSGVAKYIYTFKTAGRFYVRAQVLATSANAASIPGAKVVYVVK